MPIPENYGQVTFGFTGAGAPTGAAITFGIFRGDDKSPADCALEINGVFLATNIKTQLSNSLNHSSTLVKFGPDDTGPSAEVPGIGLMSSGDAQAAPNLSLLIQKRTLFGGRSGRGRFFLPGVPEGQVTASGTINAPYVNGMQNVMTDFLEGLQGAGWPMVVLHRPGAPLTTPSPVASLLVQATAATQRRRLRR